MAGAAPSGADWSPILANLALRLEEAGTDRARRVSVLREILVMYQGGMAGFQDLVLQDRNGVYPQHEPFHRLRRQLVEKAIREL
ncbi:hypothetical protein Vqi01_28450 [Micromonospora qiuiae]|uniref:DUF6966 domain-containing protein n=1 Tax=Micromonospora qiuiae TaxID=502268 RepID=A0ABQ4JBY8_9ACTN|nr:hypothetical protein Vqi01_28450 [Micromonospora qiuiae]